MTKTGQPAEQALDNHESFTRSRNGYRVSTTVFDSTVTVKEHPDRAQYTVQIGVPTLNSVTVEEVGPTVRKDWFETLERRLSDAPKTTRKSVELDEFRVEEGSETVTITYRFHWGNPTTAAEIAKAFVEFVEGTYVQGVIPGYEYTGPVAELIASASQGDDSGTPL